MYLAETLARRLTLPHVDRDDLISVAYLALVEAAWAFDPNRGVSFATYSRHWIRGAIRAYCRWWLGRGSLLRPVETPDFLQLEPEQDLRWRVLGKQSLPPVGHLLEANEFVEFFVRRLPRHEAHVCRLLYVEGKSNGQVAAILRRSTTYVTRVHQAAMVRLGPRIRAWLRVLDR
jgi:RNA polymerase sigma factor (sigma-70 family)